MRNDEKHATSAPLRCIPFTLLTSHSCTKHFYACICIFLGATCFALFAVHHQGVHPPCPFGQCPNEHISYRGVSLIFPSMRKQLATKQFKTCPKMNQHCCIPDVQNLDSRCVCPVKAEPEKLHRLQITALGPTCFLHLIVQQTMRPSWMSGHSSGHCLPWLNQLVPGYR